MTYRLKTDGAALARQAFAAGLMPDPPIAELRRLARELECQAVTFRAHADRLRELADELGKRRCVKN
jgi:hypothetical protein